MTRGFTLVELSIVLVIIGLIIGGVLVGRDLIKAAELRAIASEKEKIITAVMTFRTKYNCLAGDCPNATDYFGTNTAGCQPPHGSAQTNKTCNGNGDGKVFDYEEKLFWQHLAAAGLWSGFFRGTDTATWVYDSTVFSTIIGTKNLWYVMHTDNGAYNGYELYSSFGKKNIIVSWDSTLAGNYLFSPVEMFLFDSKYDDGKPAFGNIQTLSDWETTGCTNPETAPAPTAVYDTTKTGKNCPLVYLNIGF